MSLPVIAGTVLVVLALGYRFYGRLDRAAVRARARRPTRRRTGTTTASTSCRRGRSTCSVSTSARSRRRGRSSGRSSRASSSAGCRRCSGSRSASIFIGAVHDFTTLVASVRHDARSIAEVVKANLGRRAWLAILSFIWLALVYVIVAFVDVTAGTFVDRRRRAAGHHVPTSTRAARSRSPASLYLGARGRDGARRAAARSRRCGSRR